MSGARKGSISFGTSVKSGLPPPLEEIQPKEETLTSMQSALQDFRTSSSNLASKSDLDIPNKQTLLELEEACFRLLSFLKINLEGSLDTLRLAVAQSSVGTSKDTVEVVSNSADPIFLSSQKTREATKNTTGTATIPDEKLETPMVNPDLKDDDLKKDLNSSHSSSGSSSTLQASEDSDEYEDLVFSILSTLKLLYLLLDEIEQQELVSPLPSSIKGKLASSPSPPSSNGNNEVIHQSQPQSSKRRGSMAIIESRLAMSAYKALSNSLSDVFPHADNGTSSSSAAAAAAGAHGASSSKSQQKSEAELASLPLDVKHRKFLQSVRALDTLCELYIETTDTSTMAATAASGSKGSVPSPQSNRQQPIVLLRIQNFIAKNGRQLSDQRMTLTEEKRKILDYASLMSKIERIQRHRMNDQRATYHDRTQTLQFIMDQMIRAKTDEAFEKQRFTLSRSKMDEIEMNRIMKLVEKGNERRMQDQVWQSPDQQRVSHLSDIQSQLVSRMDDAKLESQRYVMSDAKEKEMFLANLLHRVDRVSQRMDDQSSKTPDQIKNEKWQQIQPTLDRLGRGKFENQTYDPRRRKSVFQ